MLKLVGVMLVLGSCGTLGLAARERLRNRVRTLEAMLSALLRIRAEIAGALVPLPTILQELAESKQTVQAQVFGEMCTRMNQQNGLSLAYHWSSTFRDMADDLGLQNEEILILRDAATFLGRYAQEQQLRNLDYTITRLEEVRHTACEELCKRGGVYRTCGIAAGIVAVLVFV